jgi:hypothetical protein
MFSILRTATVDTGEDSVSFCDCFSLKQPHWTWLDIILPLKDGLAS